MTPDDNAYHLQYDTPDIRAGAIHFIKCSNCGSEPGTPCVLLFYQPLKGSTLDGFAHAARRIEYHDWRDIYGEAPLTTAPPPHVAQHILEATLPCWNPRRHCSMCLQCTCGAPLMEHSVQPALVDVDDLLG